MEKTEGKKLKKKKKVKVIEVYRRKSNLKTENKREEKK